MNDDIASAATFHLSVSAATQRLEERTAVRSVALFRHGTLLVKYYAPRGTDAQTPHTRDEIYVIAQGRGIFFNGTSRQPFVRGDLLFARAGLAHRFEDFSDDFGAWVMFYGPEGGES
jgi:mannose-6-phosphate isomerase-like protein (cupin superfamily)